MRAMKGQMIMAGEEKWYASSCNIFGYEYTFSARINCINIGKSTYIFGLDTFSLMLISRLSLCSVRDAVCVPSQYNMEVETKQK